MNHGIIIKRRRYVYRHHKATENVIHAAYTA